MNIFGPPEDGSILFFPVDTEPAEIMQPNPHPNPKCYTTF